MEFLVQKRQRLDVFVTEAAGISRVRSGKLIREGCVLVHGRIIRTPAHIVLSGDDVSANADLAPVTETHIASVDGKVAVLYEDDACLVICKPAGISVHPGNGMQKDDITLLNSIAYLFQKRGIPFSASTVLVHRLDKDTTGCLLIAKSPAAHLALQKQFKNRTVEKTYLALVAGIPVLAEATIDAPIGRHYTDRMKMAVLGAVRSRAASTTYHVLSRGVNAALLACDLHTGRTHQIRVHLASIGHPVLGDSAYFSDASAAISRELHIERICLHAWKLKFRSPADEEEHLVEAPVSKTLNEAMKKAALSLKT
ncbi:MAG: RluA family pseudouridine synthase [Candidatus Peregrinibacteria bacterium]